MYSTWFSASPRGYCDRSLRRGWAPELCFRGAESDECCDDMPLGGVFEFELGSDVRSVSIIGGFGDREGLECLDMVEGDREGGRDESEVLGFGTASP